MDWYELVRSAGFRRYHIYSQITISSVWACAASKLTVKIRVGPLSWFYLFHVIRKMAKWGRITRGITSMSLLYMSIMKPIVGDMSIEASSLRSGSVSETADPGVWWLAFPAPIYMWLEAISTDASKFPIIVLFHKRVDESVHWIIIPIVGIE